MKQKLKLLAKIAGIVLLFAVATYIALWVPVLDKLQDPCKYYPELFEEC